MDKILVLDDEKQIVEMISEFLYEENYKVIKSYTYDQALEKMNDKIDLVILDIGLDKKDGIEICKKIREKYNIPIIFLSAKTNVDKKAQGLEAGADDYITKPFDPIELVARVKAHLRRYRKYDHQVIDKTSIGDLEIDNISKRVYKNGKRTNLSNKEYELLIYLIINRKQVVSREEILENVWESKYYGLNTVNTNIMRLRKKLEDNGKKYIKSVRGKGYIFDC